MSNKLDEIYGARVFGKPSIHMDPFEAPPASRAAKLTEREAVINTYLPERMHVKTASNTPQASQKTSLREKYQKNQNTDSSMIMFLEGYFKTNRMDQFNAVEEILEDMYAFLKENQG